MKLLISFLLLISLSACSITQIDNTPQCDYHKRLEVVNDTVYVLETHIHTNTVYVYPKVRPVDFDWIIIH